jgi:RimJ/RimL family protein N-acetyltransferase
VTLAGGHRVLIRSLRPGDRDRLARGYQQLSATSAHGRFFTPLPELSPRLLDVLTDIDHHDHEALGAEHIATGDGIAVARYVRDPHQPDVAELAVAIVDSWQRHGVGVALLDELADRARNVGIARFRADMLATNSAMVGLLERLGPTHPSRSDDPSVTTTHVDIADLERTGPDRRAATASRPDRDTFSR